MKVFYELTQKKRYDKHDKNDELVVSVRYRFQGKRLNKTTGVSVKVKDWDKEWRNRVNKEPIKSTDKNDVVFFGLILTNIEEIRG